MAASAIGQLVRVVRSETSSGVCREGLLETDGLNVGASGHHIRVRKLRGELCIALGDKDGQTSPIQQLVTVGGLPIFA